MKSNTLLTTVAAAALIAGASMVSAQAPSSRDSSGAPSSGSQTQMNQGSPGSQSQSGQMQRNPPQSGTTGQSDMKASPSQRSGESGTSGQGSSPSQRSGQSSTSGQGTPSGQSGQMQRQGSDSRSGSPSQMQQQGTSPRQGAQSGQSTQRSGQSAANITTEQRTRIRETVLRGGSVPRVSSVNFSLSVGTAVPRSVRLAPLPTTIVEIQPAWRGFLYFVVGEQIVIVDPDDHEIVAVIAA